MSSTTNPRQKNGTRENEKMKNKQIKKTNQKMKKRRTSKITDLLFLSDVSSPLPKKEDQVSKNDLLIFPNVRNSNLCRVSLC
jgi:hypothetical protein